MAVSSRVAHKSKLLFGSKYRLPVAAAVARAPEDQLFVRGIARHLGIADNLVAGELRRLEEAGLLVEVPRGPGKSVIYFRRVQSPYWAIAIELVSDVEWPANSDRGDSPAPGVVIKRPGDAGPTSGVHREGVVPTNLKPRSAHTVRAVVADGSFLTREAVAHALNGSPNVSVVATAADAQTLMASIEEKRPDVVITDIPLPPTMTDEGISIASRLRVTNPEIGVVILSQYADPVYAVALLECGSERRAYLLKDRVDNLTELVAAIRAVAAGASMIDPKVVEEVVGARARADRSPLGELTPREREVLAEIAQGKSNTAIAESLVLTKRAVEKHINSIFLKLGLADADAVSKRVKAALILLTEETNTEADQPTHGSIPPDRGLDNPSPASHSPVARS